MYGRLGNHPGTVWAQDSFPFTKSGTQAGSFFQPFLPTEAFPDPFAVIIGGEVSVIEHVPEEWALEQNYPNPFNPVTTISFTLPVASQVNLAVYDVSGRLVTTLANEWRDVGYHNATFEGSGLASGIYIYRFEADNFFATGKMVLMK
jgi:hypothetical protein